MTLVIVHVDWEYVDTEKVFIIIYYLFILFYFILFFIFSEIWLHRSEAIPASEIWVCDISAIIWDSV